MIKKILLLLMIIVVTGTTVQVCAQQTKEELQKKQEELRKEITDLNNTLADIQKNKKTTLVQLNSIRRKIAARESLINNISKEVRIIDDNIYYNQIEIYRMKKELDTLKQRYAQSIVFAYKNRGGYGYMNFLFSSTSFNDAVRRMAYLKSYRRLRETQVENIVKTQAVLQNLNTTLDANRKERNQVLVAQNDQLKEIEVEKKQQDQVVNDLKSQEKSLAAQIKKKERQRQEMRTALAAIIRREIAEAEKRDRLAKAKAIEDKKRADAKTTEIPAKNTTASNTKPKTTSTNTGDTKMTTAPKERAEYSKLESTPEGREMSIKFEGSRGALPWPINSGSVTLKFGPYHITKDLTGISDGIEIALPEGSPVKSVADGVITFVGDIGGEQAVIVKHGKYFTTYSHLSSINISKDQQVKAGTKLGSSGTDIDGEGSLLFMVTNEKGTPLNPESWLKRR